MNQRRILSLIQDEVHHCVIVRSGAFLLIVNSSNKGLKMRLEYAKLNAIQAILNYLLDSL